MGETSSRSIMQNRLRGCQTRASILACDASEVHVAPCVVPASLSFRIAMQHERLGCRRKRSAAYSCIFPFRRWSRSEMQQRSHVFVSSSGTSSTAKLRATLSCRHTLSLLWSDRSDQEQRSEERAELKYARLSSQQTLSC